MYVALQYTQASLIVPRAGAPLLPAWKK